MKLSIYQENIMKWLMHDNGNIMIQAYAGCGKTSTLIEMMKLLPKEKTKFYCAFNKDIVDEITSKTSEIENLKISTIHSLGYHIIQRNNDEKINVDENKYIVHINNNIEDYSTEYETLNYNNKLKLKSNVKKLINYARNNLCSGTKCLTDLAKKFGIVCVGDEISVVQKLLKWGKTNINTIDYCDMVWLPNVLPYRFPWFDFIFVDEAQDLSVAQQQIVLKSHNIKTRYIFCGDEYQSIYGFAGADSESFNTLKNTPNTKVYNLPICYRCGDLIVDFASQFVNGIKHNELNNKGFVKYNGIIDDIKDGDMVICRNNAPLIKLYLQFLEKGITCHILGKEIGSNLIELIELTNQTEISSDFSKKGIIPSLYKNLIDLKNNIKKNEECDDKRAMATNIFRNMYDQIQVIELLSYNIKTKEELIDKINKLFQESEKKGVILSTIHKAKGLENDNVHILCWDLFNNNLKRDRQDWENNQEKNLQYVAVTRGKNSVSIINDAEFSKYSNFITLSELEYYEKCIKKIYESDDFKKIDLAQLKIPQKTSNTKVGLSKNNIKNNFFNITRK